MARFVHTIGCTAVVRKIGVEMAIILVLDLPKLVAKTSDSERKQRYRLVWSFGGVQYRYVTAPMTIDRAITALDGLSDAGAVYAYLETVSC